LKSGILEKRFPVIKIKTNSLVFHECPSRLKYPTEWKHSLFSQADNIVKGVIPYYSYHWIQQSLPPNWFINPFNSKECQDSTKHWTRIPDFNENLGDIKNVWEASRFTWVGILARAYAVSGESKYLNTLNEWLIDWTKCNPVNTGPNWKCGQETSIRVLNLLNAAYILNQSDKPSELLQEIIKLHLRRIYSNFRYACAQRNNHATSEAAAMYIGGNWLATTDSTDVKEYKKYSDKGKTALEHLLRSLVYEDGSFAQHSTNYHRLFLDTLTFIYFWTLRLGLESFTKGFNEIAQKSFYWLLSLVDESGMCPNLGSNDGTTLLMNHSCDYLDYRPSLQAAAVMLKNNLVFEPGPWDEIFYWFDIKKDDFPFVPVKKESKLYSSGYLVMNSYKSWALLRFPFFRFRPSHNDIFHFDLWANGKNILFDSGTYSYNPDKECEVPDLKSVHSHNTLSFDGKDQMPHVRRFLLAKWIKPLMVGGLNQSTDKSGDWKGSYRDSSGNLHTRKIKWVDSKWIIHDTFKGPAKNIQIGFNFDICDYKIEHEVNTVLLPWGEMNISPGAKMTVIKHSVSKYYAQLSEVYRLVISTENNSEIFITINIY